jgi:hypothetical protein
MRPPLCNTPRMSFFFQHSKHSKHWRHCPALLALAALLTLQRYADDDGIPYTKVTWDDVPAGRVVVLVSEDLVRWDVLIEHDHDGQEMVVTHRTGAPVTFYKLNYEQRDN